MRKIINQEDQAKITEMFMSGYSIKDIASDYNLTYISIRDVLQTTMGCAKPMKKRKELWEQGHMKPVRVTQNAKPRGKRLTGSKCIPVVVALMTDKESTYFAIAKRLAVSREYVGQVAESIAFLGHDVSRTKEGKKSPIRGSL